MLRKRYGWGLVLWTVACLGAGANTLEERLAALEQRMAELAAENAALRAELAALRPPPAAQPPAAQPPPVAPDTAGRSVPAPVVQPAGKEWKLALGGLVQVHAELGDSPDDRYDDLHDRFLVRRARLNATATFAEHFLAKIEADFGAGSINAGSNLRGQMTDGYVEWRQYPECMVRLGQFKTPFGYEQLASDPKLLTIERALSSDKLTVGRQIGGALSGDLLDRRLNYAVGLFNGNRVNSGDNDNDDFMVAGRLGLLAFTGKVAGRDAKWAVAANAFTTDDTGTAFTGRREGLGFDTQLTLGPAELRAEWLRNKSRRSTGDRVAAEGWSLLAGWTFDPQWRAVVRFDTYDSNTRSGNTTTDEWTFGLDYCLLGDDLKLSLNYLYGKQPAPSDWQGRLLGRVQVVF